MLFSEEVKITFTIVCYILSVKKWICYSLEMFAFKI